MTTHLVQFSTGAASAEIAWRLVGEYGPRNVTLITADTRREHPDNWRFAHEVVDRLGAVRWEIIADGRTPMQVGRDKRCVPNDRMAVCSRVLKRELLARWREQNCDPSDTITYLGYDWTEPQRVKEAEKFWAPWPVDCPLTRPPYLWKNQILNLFRERGIEPPWLYRQGFPHANCGGACVRGGQAQWGLLLRVNPRLYQEWEKDEEETRELLGKDVSILNDRRGVGDGPRKPLTLRVFRERIEASPTLFDGDDWGACGCDMLGTADSAQPDDDGRIPA
jgi:hypothetical protein